MAPRFPLTSDANPDHNLEVSDQMNLPADVSFVLDEVLAAADTTVELATTAFLDRTLRGGDAAAEANMALTVVVAEGAANLEVRNNDR